MFYIYMILANQRFISHNFLLCRPSQRSARSQVPTQVATHQKIGSQLRAGETLDSNPGLSHHTNVLGESNSKQLHVCPHSYCIKHTVVRDVLAFINKCDHI
jgi:hypothetical protein